MPEEREEFVKIPIGNTSHYLEGIKEQPDSWKMSLVNSVTKQRINFRKKETLEELIEMKLIFENNPFPYMSKIEPDIKRVNRFIKKVIKNN